MLILERFKNYFNDYGFKKFKRMHGRVKLEVRHKPPN